MSYPIWPDGVRGSALQAIDRERNRQEELKRKGKFHWSCADLPNPVNGDAYEPDKFAVLAEEVGEVAKLVTEAIIDYGRRDPVVLREELIQVAAVAAAWVEALDEEALRRRRGL